ncbi:peptidoglycan DD-metalloendopeptidase family protein [Bradyrhizobium sp. LHD-71]|uniref:peptidoglycan DD-metalloendopeptidase family protein n=1 Tax=Bradyrhizobium sp. LHD-71 TaxID=3072141 RepID=UPI00280E2BE3|nr:peptidoglycan DD-metalloendopeptidase family protein [Bradyrhizobium sp. LHD-71]MDQ8729997.1 peptidoglycan DD-metalloendopeptidase family protein [Bradyrhizobium sp. LHD-71]
MSHRPLHLSDPSHPHPAGRGRVAARSTPPRPQPHTRPRENGYTLVHAGKRVRIGPVVFWIVIGAVVVMGAWSAATATYFAFRDDVLTRLVARQAEMQYAYEDRIAELRAQIDRTTSRQLLDQEQFEQKLEQIQRRQMALEQRTSALSGLPDAAPTGSVRVPGRGAALVEPPSTGSPKLSTAGDTVVFVAPPDREARLESRSSAFANLMKPGDVAKTVGLGNILGRLQLSLDGVEGRQMAALNSLEESFDSRMRRMRAVFTDLGLDLAGMEKAAPKSAVGGPFVPAKLPGNAGPFERQLHRINLTRAQIDRLNRTLAVVPYRKPVIGQIEFTSGFGIRNDPFLGRPAMHTGLDFRGSTGDPVRATANGKVVTAGWQGGYGKMVEIDHGNALTTRYGHLSQINVKVGEVVRIGQVVGALGSTGRSTGPHLHYETRIDGEAVDPQKFLRAGVRLGAS